MARYSPLPVVSIDPRNEAELVQAAAQTVYEASNRTLNDFSAGNPLAVLLEGQAFAQGEFLFWANQLPSKILLEWIGPFLGAMRRLGTPAVAEVEVSIAPTNTATVVPAGTTFSTNPQLTGGVSIDFITTVELVIPAGETLGKVAVYSKFTGAANNAPANSITIATNSGTIRYGVTNPRPAVGGSDIETYQQIQERFFSLIRRPNPVSSTDWQNFFIDLYGVGTLTSVQPNRSSASSYNYLTDYVLPNGEVSFFVLGPGGVELTGEQLRIGQNALNFSLPVENRGHLYPITLSQVQYNLTLEVEANGTYGRNFKESSLNFRDRLFTVLTPGTTFPADINPTVSDVDAAFYNTFGDTSRFKDPLIVSSTAYTTPSYLSKDSATYTQVKTFEPAEYIINENDLVTLSLPVQTFYPAQSSFTPYSTNKFDQTIYNNLELKQIRALTAGRYLVGDIVYYDGYGNIGQQGLHVVLENINISSTSDALFAIANGKISSVKEYKPWVVDNSYSYSNGTVIDPDIIEYDYSEGEFLPATPSNVPLNQRPGSFAWLVAQNFTLQAATNDITGAQAQILLGAPITPNTLESGSSYTANTWVCTPQVGGGPNADIDPYYQYVDITKGAVVKYAYVVSNFTYTPNDQTTSEYFDSLVSQGVIKEVALFSGDSGLPIYKYKARFDAGQYLLYKSSTSSPPSYYIAAKFFSPNSTNIQDLLDEGLVFNLAPTPSLQTQINQEVSSGVPGKILSLEVIDSGSSYGNGTYTSVPLSGSAYGFNATANVTVSSGAVTLNFLEHAGQGYATGDILTIDNSYLGGTGSGVALRVKSIAPTYQSLLKPFHRMFTFFTGDRTFLREGSNVISYTATSPVTPLFDFQIYLSSGVFVETSPSESFEIEPEGYIPLYNPSYSLVAEDTVLSEDGKNLYRVTQAFTPSQTVVNWTGLEEKNTARYEEFAGNLLRYVTMYKCEEEILPQGGKETSSIKLGVASITIIPKNNGRTSNSDSQLTYVWENTSSFAENPQLSWYTSTSFALSPPNYRSGTLAL